MMNNRERIVNAINYIETNLREELSVLDVAREIGYSLYHFSRLFQGVTGHAPRDYILKRRLTEAAREIAASRRKVIEIAFDYQFNDYETFGRAFRRVFGRTPTELRKTAALNFLQLPGLLPLTSADLEQRRRIMGHEPDLVELDGIALVGLSSLIRGSTALITELWAQFFPEVEAIVHRKRPERFYQVAFWPERSDWEGFLVLCGVAVERLDPVPPLLIAKTIPPGRYLRFIHKGRSDQVGLTYRYIFETWLPNSDYRLAQPFDFEYYGPNYWGPEHEESESEIYIPVELG